LQPEPLIHWSEPVVDYVGFLAQFISVGAVGFRYAAVRDRLEHGSPAPDTPMDDANVRALYADACARAAAMGLVAAIVGALLFATSLPSSAARAHTTVSGLVTTDLATGLQVLLTLLGLVGLALAAARRRIGWPLAAVGLILGPLSGIVNGQLTRLVNPVHRLVASLWIGTLFVLVVAGVALILRDARARERRGAMAADMVNGFSPLALTCGMIVVLTGLTTAWQHLNPLSSLWTTPYGYALLVKLACVAIVFALGAWNWRRMRPTMGSDRAAISIRRSSTGELTAAAVVLAVTAILISLPSPRPPKPPASAARSAVSLP
jgi:putative copper export protein